MTTDKHDPYLLTDEAIQDPPKSLLAALAKIGPGIVLAGSIVGSGELILTTSLGADWGFVFLWLILFSCVIKVFVQIELGRYAISSGQPTLTALDSLPGPRLGAHWLVWWWLFMLLASVFQLGAMVGLVGQAIHMAVPTVPPAAIAAAFAAFGITGVGASELYSYPYWCLEKGYARATGRRGDDPAWAERARGWLRVMTLDAWVSMVVFTVATVAFYFLGAAVLHRQDLHPKGAQMIVTLSEMYVPTFGDWTKVFFMIGAWAVLFKTLYVASAGHARLSADFLHLAKIVQYTEPGLRH